MQYSDAFIERMIDIIRMAKAELGDDLGEKQISAMMDVFDPSLEKQITMYLLVGNRQIKIRLDGGHTGTVLKKIDAIKTLRALSGMSLKDAKDIIDSVTSPTGSIAIPGEYTNNQITKFKESLRDTGYTVV